MNRARRKGSPETARREVAPRGVARTRRGPVAALFSGGLDSAVLVAELASRHPRVVPLFLRAGLVWEAQELRAARRFLAALARPAVAPLVVLRLPAGDLYGKHWSLGEDPAPGRESRDDAVFLPGRNLLLLSKAAAWCRIHGVDTIAIGTLRGNPFPDATPAFFRALARAASLGLDRKIRILVPFARLSKEDVIRRGRDLPLHLTISCLRPTPRGSCGRCNKCAERDRALARVPRASPRPCRGSR